MSTPRLYHDDPLLLCFSARILSSEPSGSQLAVILDRTAFYPEGGGQLADQGTLGSARVLDVQVDDSGVVRHLIDGAIAPAAGNTVECRIDRRRRREFMALHTGQHLLSRGVLDMAGAETVSARLGENVSTIDLATPTIEESSLVRALELVNDVIADALPIRAYFPSAEELKALPLRRAPKVESHIRVVAIGDFDVSPCGGTHTSSTAEVGLVDVLGVERYKGKIRVSFSAGPLARGEMAKEVSALRDLSREFTCGPLDVSAAVKKLRDDLASSRARSKGLAPHAAESLASSLVELHGKDRTLIARVEGADLELLRAVAAALIARGVGLIVLGGETSEGMPVLVMRSEVNETDCGALMKILAEKTGGRGGGKKERAEGRIPSGSKLPEKAAEALLQLSTQA